MCGILGGNNSKWNYDEALSSIFHRGPDSFKIIKDTKCILGFTRLSIIDLSDHAIQPMVSYDNNVIIQFNGEIYNYQRLRSILIKKGYLFKSTSDTEVVLNAYLEWGENFIKILDGMFAIAIYDKRIEKLLLFRDRVGIKPLYYFYNGKDFAFSSELKGIEKLLVKEKLCIDQTAIYDYINYLYIPEPKTIYKNIFKLEPAKKLVFNLENSKIEKVVSYWKLNINTMYQSKLNPNEVQEEVRRLIGKSVKEQLVADVPVGTFLSGGIDSSIITYEIKKIKNDIEAFSVGFNEAKYNELEYAKKMAEKYDIKLNTRIFNRQDYDILFSNQKIWFDEPFSDTSSFPTYLVSELARKKVKVVLTGDGGDEVFGGYPRYTMLLKRIEDKKNLNIKFISDLYKRLLICLPNKFGDRLLDEVSCLLLSYQFEKKPDRNFIRRKLGISTDYDENWLIKKYYKKDLPPITRGQYLDLKTYLPGDILTKVDRTTMSVSLEARVPFLSQELIEFSFGLSQEDRCPQNELKGLLKSAYKDCIPREILYRRKQGFSIPSRYLDSNKSPQESILMQFTSKLI